jgi:hypothetical protein
VGVGGADQSERDERRRREEGRGKRPVRDSIFLMLAIAFYRAREVRRRPQLGSSGCRRSMETKIIQQGCARLDVWSGGARLKPYLHEAAWDCLHQFSCQSGLNRYTLDLHYKKKNFACMHRITRSICETVEDMRTYFN